MVGGSTNTAINVGEDKLEQLKKQIENLKRGLVWVSLCVIESKEGNKSVLYKTMTVMIESQSLTTF